MKRILILIGILISFVAVDAQFTGTDSLRNYNNKYITNNAATAFTNLRLNTLIRGIIDFVDTARAGTGGGGTLGIDTLWALNDSTLRYRRNGVFRNVVLKGVYDTRRKVDTAYAVNDTTLRITINGSVKNIIIPGRGGQFQNIANAALIANGDYTQNWGGYQLYIQDLRRLGLFIEKFDADSPDYLHRFGLSANDSANQVPLDLKWSLVSSDGATDSLGFRLASQKAKTLISQYGLNRGRYSEISINGNDVNPDLTISTEGNGKTSSFVFSKTTTLSPADSIQLKAVPAATTDSILAVRAFNNGVNTVIKVPANSVGTSTILTNAGSGYRLVKTAGGLIKTTFAGYGIIKDSTTNTDAITDRVDTTEVQSFINTSNQYKFYNGAKVFAQPLEIYDARRYVIGDNSTDNTAGFQALFDAVPAGGHIYIPPGRYKINGTIYLRKPNVTITGANGNMSYNYEFAAIDSSGTVLIGTSQTANMLVDSAAGIILEKLAIINNHPNPTAGTGVILVNAGYFRFRDCFFRNFYNNVEISNGAVWNISDCAFLGAINRSLLIHNPDAPDAGDWSISGCGFYGNSNTMTHVRMESSGGAKFVNCKFNAENGGAGPYPFKDIDVAISQGTSDFQVTNCSFENFSGYAIYLNSTDTFSNIVITANQFTPYNTISGNVVYATGKVGTGIIQGNIFHDANSNSNYAINIDGATHFTIGENKWRGWANRVNTGSAPDVLVNREQKFQQLTDGGTITFNIDKSMIGYVTLGGNRNLSITNAIPGDEVELYVTQGSSGGYNLTPPASSYTTRGSFIVNPLANQKTKITGRYDGVNWYFDLDNLAQVTDVEVDYAANFIAAVEAGGDALSPTEEGAITQFVADLTTAGILNKMIAVYPMIGSTAGSHKWNLMDARDLDAAHRLTFPAGATHDGSGIDWDGSTQYGDTKLNPSVSMTLNDLHISYWSGDNSSTDFDALMGCFTTGTPTPMIGLHMNFGGTNSSCVGGSTTSVVSVLNPAFDGFFCGTRTSSTSLDFYRNTTLLGSNTTAEDVSALPNANIFLAARNATGAADFATQRCKFATIGKGLTGSEVTALYNAINTYNTTLSR